MKDRVERSRGMRGDSLETSRLKTKVKEDEDKVETQVTRSVHNDLQILQNFIFLQPLWSSVSDLLSSKIVLFGGIRKTRTNPLSKDRPRFWGPVFVPDVPSWYKNWNNHCDYTCESKFRRRLFYNRLYSYSYYSYYYSSSYEVYYKLVYI
jgi:hypothetical protein